MIRAIIIDDELKSLNSLKIEIEAYCPQVEIIDSFTDPELALTGIIEKKPDLVFLDIHMPKMSGFELLESLDDINFNVIFVTAFDQYALKAFDFNAVDYLMKPVRKQKLIQAVEKVEQDSEPSIGKSDLQAILNNIQIQGDSSIKTIAIPTRSGYDFIHIDQIKYVLADNNYCWIYKTKGEKQLVSKTLKHFENLLRFDCFFRCHKSYIVNINYVTGLKKGNNPLLIINDSTEVPIARSKKEELMRVLNIN